MTIIHKKKENSTRNEFIVSHMFLVKQEVRKLIRSGVSQNEFDELVQIGMLGLIEAANRFNQQQQCSFSVYARIRIRGSIIDELRRKDWVPRSVRARAKRLEEASSYLKNKLDRQPTTKELSSELHICEKKLSSFQSISILRSLVSMEDGGETPIRNTLPSDDQNAQDYLIQKESIFLLKQALLSCSKQEQELIHLYYFQNQSMRQIAAQHGISESRICQNLKQIRNHLAAKLR